MHCPLSILRESAAHRRERVLPYRQVCFHPAGCSESVWSGNGLRQKEPNPFVAHCKAKGGELLACETPGREQRRNETRSSKLGPYVEQLFPVLAPVLQDGTPYVICCHSMGTWMMYEFVKKLVTAGIPLPKQLIISGFPSPDIPFKDRPWPQCRKQDDEAFKDNCRGWDVNDIALTPSNFATFSPMFRDDFMLFDEYEYSPLPECIAGGLPIPMQCYYAIDDKRVKKAHLEGWKNFTSETCDVYEAVGHHLFFFDVPARAKYMQDVISRLPF